MPATAPVPVDATTTPRAGTGARSLFVDLARFVAVLMMIQGHTIDAVLLPEARTGTLHWMWAFNRGLTSCLFLLLSGFVFTIATLRHWPAHLVPGPPVWRRIRRFGLFLLIGYGLHFPVNRLSLLAGMNDERWQSFLVVDVLQCLAITLLGLQALVMVTRTPRRYAVAAGALGVTVVMTWPLVWRADWSFLPASIAAYLTPHTGSLFPLVPWSGYVLLGAVLGTVYVRRSQTDLGTFTRRYLLGGGAAFLLLAYLTPRLPVAPLGPTAFWVDSPAQFFMRAGFVLLLLALAAGASRIIGHRPPLVHALAQESLTVYALHLVLVYGSILNDGLYQRIGQVLGWGPAIALALAMWALMAAWALGWNWLKRRHPLSRVAGAR